MKGHAIVHGAVSIVNAISIGKGSALGVKLKTSAEITLQHCNKENVIVFNNDKITDSVLVNTTINEVLNKYGNGNYEVIVKTDSEIPEGKGLKSSSAASNAIVLATTSALGIKIDDLDIIKLAVNSSLKAGVSITGAFDDASASFFGGFVVTDNINKKILRKEPAPEDLFVVIYIPQENMFTKDFDKQKIMHISNSVSKVFDLAIKGDYWNAMTLNGLLHSTSLGLDLQPAEKALNIGAFAAGLSGTGPAIAAVCEQEFVKEIKACWKQLPGEVKITSVNNVKAEGQLIND